MLYISGFITKFNLEFINRLINYNVIELYLMLMVYISIYLQTRADDLRCRTVSDVHPSNCTPSSSEVGVISVQDINVELDSNIPTHEAATSSFHYTEPNTFPSSTVTAITSSELQILESRVIHSDTFSARIKSLTTPSSLTAEDNSHLLDTQFTLVTDGSLLDCKNSTTSISPDTYPLKNFPYTHANSTLIEYPSHADLSQDGSTASIYSISTNDDVQDVVVQDLTLLAVHEDAYNQYASSFEDDISSGRDVEMDSLFSPIHSPITVDVSEQSDHEHISSAASTGELFSNSDSSIQESLEYETDSSSSNDDSSMKLEDSISDGQFVLRVSTNIIENVSASEPDETNKKYVDDDTQFRPLLIGTPYPYPTEVPIDQNPHGYVTAQQCFTDSQSTDNKLNVLEDHAKISVKTPSVHLGKLVETNANTYTNIHDATNLERMEDILRPHNVTIARNATTLCELNVLKDLNTKHIIPPTVKHTGQELNDTFRIKQIRSENEATRTNNAFEDFSAHTLYISDEINLDDRSYNYTIPFRSNSIADSIKEHYFDQEHYSYEESDVSEQDNIVDSFISDDENRICTINESIGTMNAILEESSESIGVPSQQSDEKLPLNTCIKSDAIESISTTHVKEQNGSSIIEFVTQQNIDNFEDRGSIKSTETDTESDHFSPSHTSSCYNPSSTMLSIDPYYVKEFLINNNSEERSEQTYLKNRHEQTITTALEEPIKSYNIDKIANEPNDINQRNASYEDEIEQKINSGAYQTMSDTNLNVREVDTLPVNKHYFEGKLGEYYESYSTPFTTPCSTPRDHVSNTSYSSSDSFTEAPENVNIACNNCSSNEHRDWGNFEVVHSKSPTETVKSSTGTSTRNLSMKRVEDLVTSQIVLLKTSDFLELTKDIPDHEPCGTSCQVIHQPIHTDLVIGDDIPEVNFTNLPYLISDPDCPLINKKVVSFDTDTQSDNESVSSTDKLIASLNETKLKGVLPPNSSVISLGSLDVHVCENVDLETASITESINVEYDMSDELNIINNRNHHPLPSQSLLHVLSTTGEEVIDQTHSDYKSLHSTNETDSNQISNDNSMNNETLYSNSAGNSAIIDARKRCPFVDSQIMGFDICPERLPIRFTQPEHFNSQDQMVIVGSSASMKFALHGQSDAANHDGSHMTDFEFLGLQPPACSTQNNTSNHMSMAEPDAPRQNNLKYAQLNIEVKPWKHSHCSRVAMILENRDYDAPISVVERNTNHVNAENKDDDEGADRENGGGSQFDHICSNKHFPNNYADQNINEVNHQYNEKSLGSTLCNLNTDVGLDITSENSLPSDGEVVITKCVVRPKMIANQYTIELYPTVSKTEDEIDPITALSELIDIMVDAIKHDDFFSTSYHNLDLSLNDIRNEDEIIKSYIEHHKLDIKGDNKYTSGASNSKASILEKHEEIADVTVKGECDEETSLVELYSSDSYGSDENDKRACIEVEMKREVRYLATGTCVDYSSTSSISEDILVESSEEDESMSPGELVISTMSGSTDLYMTYSPPHSKDSDSSDERSMKDIDDNSTNGYSPDYNTSSNSVDYSMTSESSDYNTSSESMDEGKSSDSSHEKCTPSDDSSSDEMDPNLEYSCLTEYIEQYDGSDAPRTISEDSITYVFMDRAHSMGDVIDDCNRNVSYNFASILNINVQWIYKDYQISELN